TGLVEESGEMVDPLGSRPAPQREVVVLEQEDAHPSLVIEHAHLVDDTFGGTDPHHLARLSPIEGVDRAERTTTGASTAGEQGHGLEAEDELGVVRPIGKGQRVEV